MHAAVTIVVRRNVFGRSAAVCAKRYFVNDSSVVSVILVFGTYLVNEISGIIRSIYQVVTPDDQLPYHITTHETLGEGGGVSRSRTRPDI